VLLTTIVLVLLLMPLLAGCVAAVLFGRRSRGRANSPALVFHALHRRSPFDCSFFPAGRLEALLDILVRDGWTASTLTEYVEKRGCDAEDRSVALTFDDGFEDVHTEVLPLLAARGMKATVFPIAAQIGGAWHDDVFGGTRHASKQQLREMAELGIEIGSHTLTHADLTMLDDAALRHELTESRRIIEDAVGVAVTALSFPYGSFNARVWRHAVEAGYRCGTVYRRSASAPPCVVPVWGAYLFDTPGDVHARMRGVGRNALARARVMPQFARGTPLWLFRRAYRLRPAGDRNAAPPRPTATRAAG
jgi:peptidoglycan/xylan/chitin deacetylase (PgdA/CDA1 family)